MTYANLRYVHNAHRTYPQKENANVELTQKFQEFHKELIQNGFRIKACNIACKNGDLFWILVDKNNNCFLEQYATLIN